MIYIYALIDPRTRGVRYVGQSVDPERRYTQHVTATEDTPKGVWIRELRSLGLEPDLIILGDALDQQQANYLETWWMLVGWRQGWKLTNGTNPGGWRVAEDFKVLFASELVQTSIEGTSLAIGQERAKWIRRVETGFCAFLAMMNLFGVAYFAACAVLGRTMVGPLDSAAVWGHWLLAIGWAYMLAAIYAQWKWKELIERKAPHFLSGGLVVLDLCVIWIGFTSIVQLIQLFSRGAA